MFSKDDAVRFILTRLLDKWTEDMPYSEGYTDVGQAILVVDSLGLNRPSVAEELQGIIKEILTQYASNGEV